MYMSVAKIEQIKIFGERNSGTTFLAQLLRRNIKDVQILKSHYKVASGWKHGYPRFELCNKNYDLKKTLFIFIIRDYESWLKSMFNQPYHLVKAPNFRHFIVKKVKSKEQRPKHDVNIYKRERMNIIDIRYAKIRAYQVFYEKVDNVVFINLQYLQHEYESFLKFISDVYKIQCESEVRAVEKHTKNRKITDQNRKHDIFISKKAKKIMERKKNEELENFVQSLNKKCKFRSSFTHEVTTS